MLQKKVKSLSHVCLFATPWTVAHQAPPSMGFSREEYWSGLPFPSPGDLPAPEGWEVISLLRQTFFLFVLTKKKKLIYFIDWKEA